MWHSWLYSSRLVTALTGSVRSGNMLLNAFLSQFSRREMPFISFSIESQLLNSYGNRTWNKTRLYICNRNPPRPLDWHRFGSQKTEIKFSTE